MPRSQEGTTKLKMALARPAGFSSDEELSDDGFTFGDSLPKSKKRTSLLQVASTNREDTLPADTEKLQLINEVINNNIEEVKRLIEVEGVDPSMRPERSPKWTAVHHACSLGQVNMLSIMLDKGKADPNLHSELFTLVMAVADSTMQDEDPLIECLEMLITKGAKVDSTDWTGNHALCYAAKRGHYRVALLLLAECPKLINLPNSTGCTPLFFAVEAGNGRVIEILKEFGGNLNVVDKRGRTLYDVALANDRKDISAMVETFEKPPDLNGVVHKYPMLSNYACVLQELPDKKRGRFYGFNADALKIVNGIGLHYLLGHMAEKNLQLGELLTHGDAEWREMGIAMSFDRRKLMYSVRKFHERYWGKSCLGPPVALDGNISLFSLAKFLANVSRQLHVIASSTYYWNAHKNQKCMAKNIKAYVAKGLGHLHILEEELAAIWKIADEIEREKNVVPADLITPQCGVKKRWPVLDFISISLGTFVVYAVYKILKQPKIC